VFTFFEIFIFHENHVDTVEKKWVG
jgi:hypothetical protein